MSSRDNADNALGRKFLRLRAQALEQEAAQSQNTADQERAQALVDRLAATEQELVAGGVIADADSVSATPTEDWLTIVNRLLAGADERSAEKLSTFFRKIELIKRLVHTHRLKAYSSDNATRALHNRVDILTNHELHRIIAVSQEDDITFDPGYYNAVLVVLRQRGLEAIALAY